MNEMGKALVVFENEEFGRIRTVEIDGEIWFVGKDVAAALGYSNPRDAIAKHVDEEDRNTVAICDGKGNPNQTIINESGLFSLILSSKLESARKFKRWVTSEVLPSIRKNGSYGAALTEREKSRRIRSCFTDMLREHGYSKRHEYINTTRAMKKELGIKEKKDDMTDRQLAMVGASEWLSMATVGDESGYHEVNPVCVDASRTVAGFVEDRKSGLLGEKKTTGKYLAAS